ncbi:protein BIG GRAIN 1-like B [Panicum miliaceum]|uniref:Protein BIG GRAIN 1-like B n=1 Tax=Panicum miliaceum TaxID=4540 RepID=A0A3L6QG79_PANMI|nr:protein BIG GRAIN 1-like B [Panicum miliaceum]
MSPPHESARAPPARPNRGHQPSFSAALLDAIYQSLEADADARSSTETRPAPASPAQRTPGSSRHHRPTAAVSSPARSSVRSPRLQRPPRPCRVRPDPQPNSILLPPPPLPPPHELTGDRAEKKRRRSRKSKRTSKTKTAPFACLLNALLCNRRPARSRSVEHTPRATAAAFAAAPEPASARSILSSRASRRESAATGGVLTPARRAVRFSPVAVVVDDERGGGAVGTATRLRDAAEMETTVQAKESAAEAERRVEELLRALGVAEERERAKESSESSSDLFELEGLPAFEDAEPPRPRASAGAGLLARPRPRVV